MTAPTGVGRGYRERTWLPAEPLLSVAPRWQGYAATDYGSMGGINAAFGRNNRLQRAFHRAKHDGRVTVGMADELCIALGYHPSEVYREAWWRAELLSPLYAPRRPGEDVGA